MRTIERKKELNIFLVNFNENKRMKKKKSDSKRASEREIVYSGIFIHVYKG